MKTKTNYLSFLIMFVLALTLFAPTNVLAATTITVKPTSMNGWAFVQEVANGTGSLVAGPGTAPLNSGSARFTLDATGRELLGTFAYAGTRLDAITNLEYSTYRSSSDAGNLLAVTLQFDMDYDLTDTTTTWQSRLVFEPYFTAGSGNIPQNTWQTWTPLSGKWWMASGVSSPPIVADTPVANPCPQASPCTWGAVLAAFPDAGLRASVGALLFRAGGPWAGFDGNVDAFTIGVSSTDTTYDFEPEPPCSTVCYVDAVNGNDANGGASIGDAKKTIQAAIDAVSANGTVRVLPGNYDETATNRSVLGVNGPHQFGLFIAKDGITIQGVDASDTPITDYNALSAYVTTNATNNFGYSGIFVEGDSVTIAGLHIGPNIPGDNKTIEIIGDGFTLKDSHVDVPGGGSVYFNDWQFDIPNDISHVQSYTIDHNLFDQSTSLDITSGAGYSGPVSGRQITDNEFENASYWPSISFNGSGTGVPWFVQSVGGAVIENNSFTNTFNGTDVTAAHIRVRGLVDNSQFDWTSYWNDNTFNKAVVTLVGAYPPFDVRQYNYTSGTYSFDTRRIGVNIQSGIDTAQAGDTVLVKDGTYTENVQLNKRVSLVGSGIANTFITNTSGGNLSEGVIQVSASGLSDSDPVLIKDLTINPVGRAGISIGRFSQSTGTTVSYLALENVSVDGTNTNPCTEQERGLYVDLTSSLTHLSIKDSAFMDLMYGWYFHKAVSADTSTVQYVSVENTTFSHNNSKGMYIEKLEDASFTGVTLDTNGFGPAADFSACSYFLPNMGGVDINLKAGDYQNISFADSVITDNGLGGAREGFGLAIKARTDGATYGAFPATLDNVEVRNSYITGNERGIRLGEPGKNNPGPTNVKIYFNSILQNVQSYSGSDGSPYGGVVNQSLALTSAESNWWNSISGPSGAGPGAGDAVSSNVDFIPWLCDGTDTSAAIGFQPNVTTLCSVATKLVFSTQPGDGVAGSPLSTQPVVQAVDNDGNLDPNFNGAVTLTINNNPGGGTLGGTTTISAVNGVATFTDISVSQPGAGYTLDANDGALTGVTSAPFNVTAPGPSPAACLIYGVQDSGRRDSQFFTIDPITTAAANLGPLYSKWDLESLDIDPTTGLIYAAISSENAFHQKGYLYIVDGANGSLFLVGWTGRSNIEALAFHPTTGTLWGWAAGKGIVTINKTTGAATVVKSSGKSVEGLAWNNSGTLLYLAQGKTLYSYDPANGKFATISKSMPGRVEALEMRPDGYLAVGVHGKSTLYAFDPVTKKFVNASKITVPYNDIEGISWPVCSP